MAIDQIPKSSLLDVQNLLSLLTVEEKVSLLSGADEWQTRGIERLGIGSLKITDGPAGARGRLMVDGPRAAFFPAPIMQAASWSKSDIKSIGRLLCKEAKSKSAQIVAAPTMCCVRNPLGGRNFETFSEDPYLTGVLATEYVSGVQESGEVIATAKHFVANEQEFERFSVNAIIDEPSLREIYLRPFEMLVRSSSPPGCVMTAYNCVNDTHMDMHSGNLEKVLRKEWNFNGLVMSDWGGTNSTVESVLAGCDLEMPGPSVQRGNKLLHALTKKGSSDMETAIDRSCERILSLAKRHKLLGLSPSQVRESRHRPEISATSTEDLRRLRETVGNGHVLLKNSGKALPLRPGDLHGKKIAFIGPNAKVCSPGGGGSATMNPQYQSHPLEAFQQSLEQLNIDAQVRYAVGAQSMKWLPLASIDQWSLANSHKNPDDPNIFRVDFFASADLSGPISETQYRSNSNIDLTDSGPAGLRESGKPYSLRVTSFARPRSSGKHTFSITSVGDSRLFIDDQCLINNFNWKERGEAFYAFSSSEVLGSMVMDASRSYKVVIEASSRHPDLSLADEPAHVWSTQPSVRLGFLEELSETLISDAVATANECDYSIAVIGLNGEWESEGYDRQTMALPGKQDELIEALLTQANRPENIIIVNQSGSAVEMPWADKAGTILQAWYGGQEAGNALADVLLGLTNPSGRLPFTWPKRYSDLPFAHSETWPGVGGHVHYTESTDVGYRWYQKHRVQPQWWFGHGLGYSSFSAKIHDLRERLDEGWEVVVDVENVGAAAGQEVVQCYTWPSDEANAKELRMFDKTSPLAGGDKETIVLQVSLRDMAHWVDRRWCLPAGIYCIGLGENAGTTIDIPRNVRVRKTLTWDP